MGIKKVFSILLVSIILFSMVFAGRSWTGFLLTLHGREIIDTSVPGEEAEEYAVEDHVSEESVGGVEEPVIVPSSGSSSSRGSLRDLLAGFFGFDRFRGPGVSSNGDGNEGGSATVSSEDDGGVCGTGEDELCEGFTDSARVSYHERCSDFQKVCDETYTKIYYDCVDKGRADGFESNEVCVCYNTFDCSDYEKADPQIEESSEWNCSYQDNEPVCLGRVSANSLGLIRKEMCSCYDTSCAKDLSISGSFFGDDSNPLCVSGNRDDCCNRRNDASLGQCARVDVERAFGPSKIVSMELDGEAKCTRSVDVYACYEGCNPNKMGSWSIVANDLNGDRYFWIAHKEKEVRANRRSVGYLHGFKWKKAKYIDICTDHDPDDWNWKGCDYNLQYVVFTVMKDPLNEPPSFTLEDTEPVCANSVPNMIKKVGKRQYDSDCARDKTIDEDCSNDLSGFDSLSLSDSLCLMKPSGRLYASRRYDPPNRRAGDGAVGECARIDLGVLGHGAVKVDSFEMRVVSDGCHDDMDVYACYEGENCDSRHGWTRIVDNLDGSGKMPYRISGTQFGDARLQAIDVCVDHFNGCSHKLDWVKVKVAY